jgi:metallo-beta-lactamase family protein
MKISFFGAAETVTGSKYLVEEKDSRVLVDCGLFQGHKELRMRNWEEPPIEPAALNGVVLTHAHIDHTGYIPLLVKKGFKKKIYCTPGTYDLCRVLLPDSAHLQEEDADLANRKKFSKHNPALPLYTVEDAMKALEHFHPVEYNREFAIAPDIKAELIPSGHIIGSAFVVLKNPKTTLTFSGDLGRPNDAIMLPPRWIKKTDYLVLESTYGGRQHPRTDVLDNLEAAIDRTIKRRGVVLIPAFAVARAQSVLYAIYLLKRSKRIKDVPVYLNSPMAISATEILSQYKDQHRLSEEAVLGLCNVAKYVRTVEESKELDRKREPMIIISASGMATGGRILHHLKTFASGRENTILLTGFQAAGTRGDALREGAKIIKIHGEEIEVNAEVEVLENLSAHADQDEILQWLSHFKMAPKKVFLTHGELTGAEKLKAAIEQKYGWPCEIPKYLDEAKLD